MVSERILTSDDLEQFYNRGFVTLHDCFTRDVADKWVNLCYKRLGYERSNPSTWAEPRVHMPGTVAVDVKNFAPKAWQATCELMGGEQRIQQPALISDGLIMNFGVGKDKPWNPPSAKVGGWHKDGDFFKHFLDSPEQGLLTIVLWTDILSHGGGTFIACDSVPVVARYLRDHPEGVHPNAFPMQAFVDECTDFIELTGKVGDIVLMHPYMLHAVSQNVLGVERAITNPPFHLKAPMEFNRADDADFSPVERAVLRGLGVERLDFQPTEPREAIVPERVRVQAHMAEEQKKRLAAAAG